MLAASPLRRRWRELLLLSAFVLRALVPVGFMPSAGGLILCSGYGIAGHDAAYRAFIRNPFPDLPGRPRSPGSGRTPTDSGVCPFAAAASAMARNLSAGFPIRRLPVQGTVVPPLQPVIPRDITVLSRLPRGPPALA